MMELSVPEALWHTQDSDCWKRTKQKSPVQNFLKANKYKFGGPGSQELTGEGGGCWISMVFPGQKKMRMEFSVPKALWFTQDSDCWRRTKQKPLVQNFLKADEHKFGGPGSQELTGEGGGADFQGAPSGQKKFMMGFDPGPGIWGRQSPFLPESRDVFISLGFEGEVLQQSRGF